MFGSGLQEYLVLQKYFAKDPLDDPVPAPSESFERPLSFVLAFVRRCAILIVRRCDFISLLLLVVYVNDVCIRFFPFGLLLQSIVMLSLVLLVVMMGVVKDICWY